MDALSLVIYASVFCLFTAGRRKYARKDQKFFSELFFPWIFQPKFIRNSTMRMVFHSATTFTQKPNIWKENSINLFTLCNEDQSEFINSEKKFFLRFSRIRYNYICERGPFFDVTLPHPSRKCIFFLSCHKNRKLHRTIYLKGEKFHKNP